MIDDAIGPAKAHGCDDFFVIDTFVLVAWRSAMSSVAVSGNRSELSIVRHVVDPNAGCRRNHLLVGRVEALRGPPSAAMSSKAGLAKPQPTYN